MAKTRAQHNRSIRQEALREWLSKKCTAQHLVDNLEKMEELALSDGWKHEELLEKQFLLQKYKTANEQRLKILTKYLPDLKSQEITGEGGGTIDVNTIATVTDEMLERIIAEETSSNRAD